MKNIAGAIEAYRNAVEIDPKDFRGKFIKICSKRNKN
jgi:hypothetical protein